MAFGNEKKDYPSKSTCKTGFYACHAKPYTHKVNQLAWIL
jgi:hypothetical protein